MTDLIISAKLTADGSLMVAEVKASGKEIDKLKASAKGAATETTGLGTASKKAGADLQGEARAARAAATAQGDLAQKSRASAGAHTNLSGQVAKARGELASMARDAGGSGASIGKLGNLARNSMGDIGGLGGIARAVAGDIGGLGAAGEAGAVALAGIAAPAAIAVGAVAALGAGFTVAYSKAQDFSDKLLGMNQALAYAGVAARISASDIGQSAAKIAGDTGRAFDDVVKAELKLATAGKLTGAEIDVLADRGAKMAATYGLDVVEATTKVSDAFLGLGTGETKQLVENFKFLDAATLAVIVQLAKSGKTAEAQRVFLDALAKKVHGAPGSVSEAFGNAKGAIGDWAGALLNSWGPIQAVKGWLQSLSDRANKTAEDLRKAAFASPAQKDRASTIANVRSLQSGAASWPAGSAKRAEFQSRIDAELSAYSTRYRAYRAASATPPKRPEVIGEDLIVTGKRPGSNNSSRSGGGGTAGVSAEARQAQQELQQLQSDLASLTRAFAPATAAADDYAETLAKIKKLEDTGTISNSQAVSFTIAAADAERERKNKALEQASEDLYKKVGVDPLADVAQITENITNKLDAGFAKATDTFRTDGIDAAQAIAQVLGGKLGGTVSKILGLLSGAQSGNFNSVGGKLGGILTLAAGGTTGQPAGSSFGSGFAEVVQPIAEVLKTGVRSLVQVFDKGGDFEKTMGGLLGGAGIGQMASSAVLGSKGSSTGSAIGGALGKIAGQALGKVVGGTLGKALGPLGSIAGGLLGGAIGGLFMKTKTGSSQIVAGDGGLVVGSTAGNSAAFKSQSKGMAGAVGESLMSIAEQLGGIVTGNISTSIGVRKGKPVVDTTGKNRTKGAGVVSFAAGDEAGARAFAIADALSDGVIAGISEKVRSALSSSSDVDRALREALKVDALEQLLGGFGADSKKAFVDFERQAKERLRIAGKYGFDLVKLEAENAKERNKLFESSIENATGGLRQLLEDMLTGDRSAGTLNDRRTALIAKRDALAPLASTDAEAASKLADVLDQLERVSLEAFGTAGAQYTSDRALIETTAQSIITQASIDLLKAQNQARTNAGTDQATTETLIAASNASLAGINGLLDESNSLQSQMAAILARIASGQATMVDLMGAKTNSVAFARLLGSSVL